MRSISIPINVSSLCFIGLMKLLPETQTGDVDGNTYASHNTQISFKENTVCHEEISYVNGICNLKATVQVVNRVDGSLLSEKSFLSTGKYSNGDRTVKVDWVEKGHSEQELKGMIYWYHGSDGRLCCENGSYTKK